MLRTKSGCITCRIRRVKCDETKPECRRCLTSKRICDGYLSSSNKMSRRELVEVVRQLSIIGPVSQALTKNPYSSNPTSKPLSSDDILFFNLFKHVTIPGTCKLFPSSFWERNVMQLTHTEPAIWHAAIALGAMHQRSEAQILGKNKEEDQKLTRRAAAHYGEAMALAKDLGSGSKIGALSVMLASIASMMDRWAEMQQHVIAGLNIVSQNQGTSSELEAIRGSLMRLDLQAMTFSDSNAPYPYEDSSSVFAVDQFLATPDTQELSLEDLSSEFFGLSRTMFILDGGDLSESNLQGPWLTKLEGFLRRLSRWEKKMSKYEDTHQENPSERTTRLSLRMYHAILRALISAQSFGSEMRWDSLLGHFEYIIRIIATLEAEEDTSHTFSLTLEPGMVIPLWMVIHRCRHYGLRHAGLQILRASKRIESMWKSGPTATTLATLVAVEEESLQSINADIYVPAPLDPSSLLPWSAWSNPTFQPRATLDWYGVPLIPEMARVKDLLGATRFSEGCVDLRLLMNPVNEGDTYGPVREITAYF
ncbi:hypothetical protein B0J11DRAFT_464583 [Dendryphion nanum]|uniref:Zn(2)-C6 fungal-type domain-containing protein n=1 Tax=Dendryphion nanum TaxID=256645 RepID=A0A9P9DNV6_9PLEO|nr:hypothetical protein B0J11DRAFT_464583 [Dendryphion nanum]